MSISGRLAALAALGTARRPPSVFVASLQTGARVARVIPYSVFGYTAPRLRLWTDVRPACVAGLSSLACIFFLDTPLNLIAGRLAAPITKRRPLVCLAPAPPPFAYPFS